MTSKATKARPQAPIDPVATDSLLFDFYGKLLTERQQQVMELYHEENLSLSEIAEEFAISRAAVHESLKAAERTLHTYEEKLGLVALFLKRDRALATVGRAVQEIAQGRTEDQELLAQLEEIQAIIAGMDE